MPRAQRTATWLKIKDEMKRSSGKDLTVIEEDIPKDADIADNDHTFLQSLPLAERTLIEASLKKEAEARKRLRERTITMQLQDNELQQRYIQSSLPAFQHSLLSQASSTTRTGASDIDEDPAIDTLPAAEVVGMAVSACNGDVRYPPCIYVLLLTLVQGFTPTLFQVNGRRKAVAKGQLISIREADTL